MAWELGGEYEDHYGSGVEGGQMRDFGFSLGCSALVAGFGHVQCFQGVSKG